MAVYRTSAVIPFAISMVISGLALAESADTTQAPAPTFTVNSVADVVAAPPLTSGPCETAPGNNVCTLRAAIMKANHFPGGGATIRFAPGVAQYILGIPPSGQDDETNGDLNITSSMTIIGNGMSSTVIDGNGVTRVLNLSDASTRVTISGVTIRNGHAYNVGGGIYSVATLTLDRSAIVNNVASGLNDWGGGIYSAGSLTLTRSLVNGNTTGNHNAYGGAIYSQADLLISDTTISGNRTFAGTSSPGQGGGLFLIGLSGTTATIIDSTISGNRGDLGGGIYKSGAPVNLINTTISGNLADTSGAGIYAKAGTTALYNVTISDNRANIDGVGSGTGGGLTIATNATVTMNNSIVARNAYVVVTGQGQLLENNECLGTLTSQGNNLMYFNDPSTCIVSGAVNYAEPLLTPLQDNGGPTATHALMTGSAAIDAGALGGCADHLGAAIARDQRGGARPYPAGGRCDLGAVEFARILDVDDSSPSTPYDALTDGLLVLRYMFGLTGSSLTANAIGGAAHRNDAASIKSYLDANAPLLDIDGNGTVDALTDGLLVIRYLFGSTGPALIQGAIGPNATRTTAAQIQTVLAALRP